MKKNNDARFSTPIYTVAEVARYLNVPASTFSSWVHGYKRSPPGRKAIISGPVISGKHAGRTQPQIPFIGLAEGMVVAAFRRAGVSMQHIRRSIEVLQSEIGLQHALASQQLFTDGARILYDYARAEHEEAILTVVVTRQRVFHQVVQDYLLRISYADDGWASRVILPITSEQLIKCDPKMAFGRPVFISSGAPMDAVIKRFQAGEAIQSVARDFDLAPQAVEEVIRASLAHAS